MKIKIRGLRTQDLPLYDAHFARHRAESGRGDYHFMPFEPDDPNGPRGIDRTSIELPLTELGWQRWWVAWAQVDQKADDQQEDGQKIVGHLDLKGGQLVTNLHRCVLGIGIERAYRGQGLGKRLMLEALAFTRAASTLSWLDLNVFAHNANARSLYSSLGFVEIGLLKDQFRIEGESFDDVMMTLPID